MFTRRLCFFSRQTECLSVVFCRDWTETRAGRYQPGRAANDSDVIRYVASVSHSNYFLYTAHGTLSTTVGVAEAPTHADRLGPSLRAILIRDSSVSSLSLHTAVVVLSVCCVQCLSYCYIIIYIL